MFYDNKDWGLTLEEFIESFSFVDEDEVYTNGLDLIPVFRVDQLIEYYFKERICKPMPKPNDYGFSTFYCKCGNKLLEVANGIDECLPNYCSNCGVKIIKENDESREHESM